MILYHYCSTPILYSIITQKKIRLSLLSLSNDSKEGKHVLDIANRLLPETCAHKQEILEQLQLFVSHVSAVGFCLSAKEDVLSQWRGYADDAKGVAIGFDRNALETIAEQESNREIRVRVCSIAYDDEFLAEVIQNDLYPIIQHYESGHMVRPRVGTILTPMSRQEKEVEQQRYEKSFEELGWMLLKIIMYAYQVKSPFFREEAEWRILAILPTMGNTLNLSNAQFHPSSEKLTPFTEFPLKAFSSSIIKEVILGPRHQTPDEVVRLFLNSQGYEHVQIRRSGGSYR